ncbi:ArsR family transcriptional regulator [Nocardia sp. MH4]|jgi:DNA-binding transcriptional ArsR family regulator|uniref:ArsR/SmtB family transcription factor n=1 Tax=Nocardia TaxID=1817 RepID=UPI001C4F3A35|nr:MULTISPECIES: metalloregulator ArsR/SmtB family transcription factor [Nocardia]MBW0270249.1 ArsR family transcriptional regulator [Nocardia sp. MH4]
MDVFEALADPVRRDLLVRLAGAPARVVDLAAEYPISRPAISKHLRLLTEAGLVEAEPQGRERHYRLAPEGLAPLRAYLEQLPLIRPLIPEHALDGLDLEVRRTTRERRATTGTATDKEQTA